jgi:hypothetical protein
MNEKGQIQILFLIALVILLGLLAGAWSWAEGRMPARTTNDGIYMIQPQGANPQKDFANSQSNLNNAQANTYNAQATAVIIDAQGNYAVNVAQATAIVADSNQGPVNIYNQGQQAGRSDGMKTFGLGTLALVCIGFVALLVVRR